MDGRATASFRLRRVTFASRGKSNQKRLPLVPAVSCSARVEAGAAQIARTLRSRAAIGLMVRVYDRPLLRSSARAEGAVAPKLDRFAMWTTGTRMQASGLRLWFELSLAATPVYMCPRDDGVNQIGQML